MGEANARGNKMSRVLSAMEAKGVKYDLLVIYKSDTGEEPWTPVHADDVPEWLKTNMEIMGKLQHDKRNAVTNEDIPGCPWYRAEQAKIPSGAIIQ